MPLYALGDHRPILADPASTWIAPDAHVIGQVFLGADCGLWFGATLRGDNEPITIGERTNIQEGAVGHTDMGYPLVVGRGCTIGHRAIVHGCMIEDDVLIGMGATIMNGARIGAGSIVGAGALVTENKVFPPGSLIVGTPAKLVRPLGDDALVGLRRSADHYAEAAKRFIATLKRID